MITCWKNIVKSRIKLSIALKKNLILNLLRVKKYLKTKIKSYKGKARTFFYNDITPNLFALFLKRIIANIQKYF